MYYHFVKQKTLKIIFSVIRPKKSPILKKFMGIPKIELETNINHRMSKKKGFSTTFWPYITKTSHCTKMFVYMKNL